MVKYGIIIAVTLGFSILDIITGYLGAVLKKTVSSAKMRQGLIKKAVLVVVIAVAALLQYAQTLVDLGISIPLLTIVCSILIWMETTSILENANKIMGGKLEKVINKILPKKKEDDE